MTEADKLNRYIAGLRAALEYIRENMWHDSCCPARKKREQCSLQCGAEALIKTAEEALKGEYE